RSRRKAGVIGRERARRLRGTRNSLRIAQASCRLAQRRWPRRRQRRRQRRQVQVLSLRSTVPAIAVGGGTFGYFTPARSGLNATAPAIAAARCFSICPARKPFV